MTGFFEEDLLLSMREIVQWLELPSGFNLIENLILI